MDLVIILAQMVLFILILHAMYGPNEDHNTPKEAFLSTLLENYVHGKRYSDDYANIYCAMEVYIALCNYEKGIIPKQAYLLDYCVRATGIRPVDIETERIISMKTRKVKPAGKGAFAGHQYSGSVIIDNQGRVISVEKPPEKAIQDNKKLVGFRHLVPILLIGFMALVLTAPVIAWL